MDKWRDFQMERILIQQNKGNLPNSHQPKPQKEQRKHRSWERIQSECIETRNSQDTTARAAIKAYKT